MKEEEEEKPVEPVVSFGGGESMTIKCGRELGGHVQHL